MYASAPMSEIENIYNIDEDNPRHVAALKHAIANMGMGSVEVEIAIDYLASGDPGAGVEDVEKMLHGEFDNYIEHYK